VTPTRLRAAAGSCFALDLPIVVLRARLDLGDALDAIGDHEAACEVWRGVVERWGGADARWRTARRAAERLTACE